VAVDVQFGISFAIGTLPWQPILGAKSAKISKMPTLLGVAFHSGWQDGKVDGCINTPDVLCTSHKKFGELWSTNPGVHSDHLGTV